MEQEGGAVGGEGKGRLIEKGRSWKRNAQEDGERREEQTKWDRRKRKGLSGRGLLRARKGTPSRDSEGLRVRGKGRARGYRKEVG